MKYVNVSLVGLAMVIAGCSGGGGGGHPTSQVAIVPTSPPPVTPPPVTPPPVTKPPVVPPPVVPPPVTKPPVTPPPVVPPPVTPPPVVPPVVPPVTPPPVVPTNTLISGVWNTSNPTYQQLGLTANLIIAPDGNFFMSTVVGTVTGYYFGTMTIVPTPNADINTVNVNYTFTMENNGVCPGNVIPCTSAFNDLSQNQTDSGNVSSSSNLTLFSWSNVWNFDPNSNGNSDLSFIQGNYKDQSGNLVVVDSAGVISIDDSVSGCHINGQVSIVDPTQNVYEFTLNYSQYNGSCVYVGATGNGLTAMPVTGNPQVVAWSITYQGSTTNVVFGTWTKE